MFKYIIKLLTLILISFSLIFSPIANSAELMSKGSVLKQESMVFSVEEADALRVRIEGLELTERKMMAMEDLIIIQKQELVVTNDMLKIKSSQVNEWRDLSDLHLKRLDKMERREKISSLENIGWFILGVTISGGAIYLGDKIGDNMEKK